MRDHGRMMSKMDLASLSYRMGSTTRESFMKATNMEEGCIDGPLGIPILGISGMTNARGWAHMYGVIKAYTKESGREIG